MLTNIMQGVHYWHVLCIPVFKVALNMTWELYISVLIRKFKPFVFQSDDKKTRSKSRYFNLMKHVYSRNPTVSKLNFLILISEVHSIAIFIHVHPISYWNRNMVLFTKRHIKMIKRKINYRQQSTTITELQALNLR